MVSILRARGSTTTQAWLPESSCSTPAWDLGNPSSFVRDPKSTYAQAFYRDFPTFGLIIIWGCIWDIPTALFVKEEEAESTTPYRSL